MTTPSRWPTLWRPGRVTPTRYEGKVALLAAILRRHVPLPGALCRGQAPMFDADQLDGESEAEHADRLTLAVSVCQRCPELEACPAPLVRP